MAIVLIKKIIQLNLFRKYNYFIRQIISRGQNKNDNNNMLKKINKFINLVNKQFKNIVFDKIKKINLNNTNVIIFNPDYEEKYKENNNLNCLNISNCSHDYSSHGTKQVIDLLNSINNKNNNEMNYNDFYENKEVIDNTPLITDNITFTPSNDGSKKLRFIIKNNVKKKLFSKISKDTNQIQNYLIKNIFLRKWFNKVNLLKQKNIRNNKVFHLFKKNLFINAITKIKNEGKRRVLIKFFINIKKMKYSSLIYSIKKIKKYVHVKSQIMEVCASIIQRNYRLHLENSMNNKHKHNN